MNKTYSVEQHNGRWGFWADAFDEKAMLEAPVPAAETFEPRVVGGFLHPTMGARRIMAVTMGGRKISVAHLPKVRTFFAFAISSPIDGLDETWRIDWVGHIGCFPYPQAKAKMLETHDANTLIAQGITPDGEQMWVCAVEILPDMLVPPTSCCNEN